MPAASDPRRKAKKQSPQQPAPTRTTTPLARADHRPLIAILALAFCTRAYKLIDLFPPLGDESIYMRWAEIIDNQGQWFISLLDGKPPLSYWFIALLRIANEGDPLLQIRLLSVVFGVASTFCIYVLTRKLANGPNNDFTGIMAAALYAVFPWAILYDRIGYSESFVNFFGLLIALVSVSVYQRESLSAKDGLIVGLAFGLGIFTKQTVLLFALTPLAAAFFYARGKSTSRLYSLAICYLVAGSFLVANYALTPEAPTLAGQDAVFHQTGFFADPVDLLRDPLLSARTNVPKLFTYIGIYVGWPLALFALFSLVLLRASFVPLLFLAGSFGPLVMQVFTLEAMFPTRYSFPHFSIWLIVAALGATEFATRYQKNGVLALGALVIVGPMLYRDARMLTIPQEGLHQADAIGFLADSSFVGYGALDAVSLLEDQARSGPFILLTDPYWGPPADVFFAYLNKRQGIQVYEAWWLQMEGPQPIMPNGIVELIRSQYERVPAGQIDFRQAPRVFYATDTHQTPRQTVLARQPSAQRIGSFAQPGSRYSIDVYRLK